MASIRTRRTAAGHKTWQVRQRGSETRTFTAHTRAQEKQAREDANRYALELGRRRLLGELYVAPTETFGYELDGLLDRKRARKNKASTMQTLDEVKLYLKPLRDRKLTELRRAEVEDLLAAVAKRAPRRAQMATALVKQVIRAARGRGQRVDEAILEIEPPKADGRAPVYLTVKELTALVTWMPESVKRIAYVAGLTGMRQGELLALTDRQLDLANSRLWIPTGKTRSSRRYVALPHDLVLALREQLLARPSGTRLVFPAPKGGAWNADNFMTRVFRPAREHAGLDQLTFHDLRHTAISLMALAGWRPEHIAEQVGHADGGALILRRYRHLFKGEMEAQVAKLDVLIRGQVVDEDTGS